MSKKSLVTVADLRGRKECAPPGQFLGKFGKSPPRRVGTPHLEEILDPPLSNSNSVVAVRVVCIVC